MQNFIKKINIAEMGLTGRSDFYHESSKVPFYHMQTLSEINLSEKLLRFSKETRWSPLNTTIVENFGMGFALPLPTHKNKIVKKARAFVKKIFDSGAGAGGDNRNATPAEIVQRMRSEEVDGVPSFQPREYFEVQQVKYLIYQFAKQLKEKKDKKDAKIAEAKEKKDRKAEKKKVPKVKKPAEADSESKSETESESESETESEAEFETESELESESDEENEERQQIKEHAIAVVDAVENFAVIDNTIDILEAAEKDEREASEKHPFVFSGIPICDLAKTISMKKRRDLSPLQFLDDGNIKNIATVVGSNTLTQELCASQKTKEAKFKEIELAIIQFVLGNCTCCSNLPFRM